MTRSRLLLIIGLACSAIFLWLALRTVDTQLLGASLARVHVIWALPFLVSLAGFCWFKAARWSVLLEPVTRASTGQLFPTIVIGYAGTTLLPMQLGEVVRAYAASQRTGIRLAPALTSIALERILDVLVLLCLLGVIPLVGAQVDPAVERAGLWFAALGALALGGLIAYAIWPERIVVLITRLSAPLPQRWRLLISEQLAAGSAGLAILRRPSRFLALLVTSALQWSCMLLCCWISLQALGLALPLTAALLVVVTNLIGMSLPSGPGYVGTVQLAFWLALSKFGVVREDAIAASIFYHVMICGPVLLGGIAYFYSFNAGLRRGLQALRRGESVPEAPVNRQP